MAGTEIFWRIRVRKTKEMNETAYTEHNDRISQRKKNVVVGHETVVVSIVGERLDESYGSESGGKQTARG